MLRRLSGAPNQKKINKRSYKKILPSHNIFRSFNRGSFRTLEHKHGVHFSCPFLSLPILLSNPPGLILPDNKKISIKTANLRIADRVLRFIPHVFHVKQQRRHDLVRRPDLPSRCFSLMHKSRVVREADGRVSTLLLIFNPFNICNILHSPECFTRKSRQDEFNQLFIRVSRDLCSLSWSCLWFHWKWSFLYAIEES